VPSDLKTLLRDFAGPYALSVTPPSVDAEAGLVPSNFIGGLFFLAKLIPDADVEQLQEVAGTVADDAVAGANASESWQYQVVIDNGWLAVNAVPATIDLDQLPQDLLASDPTYKWVRPGFVQNGSNVYLNVDAVVTAFEPQLPSRDALAALGPIRAVGISTQTDGQGNSQAHMQVLLAAR
jgi:hypothetical protein